jgi:fucose permease
MGAGTVAGLPLTSSLLGRQGSRRVALGAGLLACAALAVAGQGRSLAALLPVLAVLGAALGAMDVAMNAQAALFEGRAGRSIMSSFHGLFSLGALAGAALAGTSARRAVGPGPHLAAVAAILGLVLLVVGRGLLVEEAPAGGTRLGWPSRAVARIGLVAACAAVVEGGIADWSGLYLRDALATSAAFAAGAYGGFSLAMMVGRLAGDRVIDRFGRVAVVRGGAALTAVALATSLAVARGGFAAAALAVAGLGICTIFPVAFSAAGQAGGAAPGPAIAAVATMAYGAGLLGPPAVGFVAGASSLPLALWLLVAAATGIVALAGSLSAPGSRSPAGP